MAITVDWGQKEILIPRADMTLIQSNPTEIRQLDTNIFRLTLKDLEDDEEGMPFQDTHTHSAPVTVGGVQLARVVEIINGYTVTFEDGQYAVNLQGSNNNILDRTNKNQVSVNASNSAGLVTSDGIEAIEYENQVTFDPGNSSGRARSGGVYPIGTLRVPVDNLADAKTIMSARGFNRLKIIAPTVTLNAGTDLSDSIIIGEGSNLTNVTIDPSADVTNTRFEHMTISGTLDGGNILYDCEIGSLNYVNGIVNRCVLKDTITLGGNAAAEILNCFSGIPGQSTPTVDMGGSGQSLAIRNYNGGITLTNKTGPENVSLDINSGQIILASSVTNGTIVCRGVGKLTDNSTGLTAVDDEMMTFEDILEILRLTGNKVTRTGDIITIYEEDEVTPWRTYDLSNGGRVQT